MDVSLYKEESQLKKRKGKKRKATSPLKADKKAKSTRKSPEAAKVRKVAPKVVKKKTGKVKKVVVKKQQVVSEVVKKAVAQGRAERAAKRRGPEVAVASRSPVVDQKKARVLAKVARKSVQKNQAPAKSEYFLVIFCCYFIFLLLYLLLFHCNCILGLLVR